MDAALAALLGTGIGALAGFGTAWLTQRQQTRRDLLRFAVELAQAERQERIEKLRQTPGGGPLLPIAVYVNHHARILRAVADGTYGPELIRELDQEQIALVKAIVEGRA